jgi:uncharacterized membrane protein YfcA
MKDGLLIGLAAITVLFVSVWLRAILNRRKDEPSIKLQPSPFEIFLGFATNFLDTLGIGSFATTSSMFKLKKLIADEEIPGTLNVGHCLPSIVEASIFISIVQVDVTTLVSMIGASIAGAWFGAGVVSRMPRLLIQISLGLALLVAACLMLATQFHYLPAGGEKIGLQSTELVIAIIGNFILGALMTLGIGLFAPCMIMVSLLGMNPKAAFPIMMGSCAFLMAVGSIRFAATGRYSLTTALGLTLGGIPGVLIAAFIVKSLPLDAVRWLVIVVVVYTSAMLLRSAAISREKAT